MPHRLAQDESLSEVHGTVDTTLPGRKGWRRLFSFLGPAYLVSVGYMDPGNWATDLQGGSQFGYTLVWVLLMSNLMALLLQGFAARLGIVRGRDLAQANREVFPAPVNLILYVLAEIAIAACDLAEVLGMAIGIQLLTGLPLIWGVSITVLDTFLLLYLQKLGIRKMEAFIIGLVAVVTLSFLIELFLAKPNPMEVAQGLVPHLPGKEALYIAIGIIGATVMPHNLYLHSALVQTRKISQTPEGIRRAIKFNRIDSAIALNIAFVVNAAILILAATAFFKTGHANVASIHEAHHLLAPLLGSTLAPKLFAIALIAAGQSSTITGTLAGQIVMEGYLQLRINPLLRRVITRMIAILPALLVILYFGESKVDALLILSQVILSLQLGFAIIPLIHFVSDKTSMGAFAINIPMKVLAWIIAAVLIGLNLKMLFNESLPWYQSGGWFLRMVLIGGGLFFIALLLYISFFPLIRTRFQPAPIAIHPEMQVFDQLAAPVYRNVAIALEFSSSDGKLLAAAIGLGRPETVYHLVHIVESASAAMLEKESDDYETRRDKERMEQSVAQLAAMGYSAKGYIGYKYRTAEIIRIVTECQADLLVMGAHRHGGLKDIVYGETVNSVRHEIEMPVFIVNV